jgi:DNA-binding NtrC family response regulator
LRERITDIPAIAEFLLHQIASDLKTTKRTLHPDILQQLMSYSFPGNVRELRNLLERACILTSSQRYSGLIYRKFFRMRQPKNRVLPMFNWSIAAGRISLTQHARILGAKDH